MSAPNPYDDLYWFRCCPLLVKVLAEMDCQGYRECCEAPRPADGDSSDHGAHLHGVPLGIASVYSQATDEEAAAPMPEGEWARVEIMGHDREYGWVTERTRAGVVVMVVSDWDGRVKAEIPGQSLYKFVPLPTPQRRPEPQRALTRLVPADPDGDLMREHHEDWAGGRFTHEGEDDDPDDYVAHAPGCHREYCNGECTERPAFS